MSTIALYFRPGFCYHHLHIIQPSPMLLSMVSPAYSTPSVSCSFLSKLSQSSKILLVKGKIINGRTSGILIGGWRIFGVFLASLNGLSWISIFPYRFVLFINPYLWVWGYLSKCFLWSLLNENMDKQDPVS